MRIAFGFRNNSHRGSRLADSATATGAANAISVDNGWNNEGVEKKDSCGKYEQYTFHDCFLLVTEIGA